MKVRGIGGRFSGPNSPDQLRAMFERVAADGIPSRFRTGNEPWRKVHLELIREYFDEGKRGLGALGVLLFHLSLPARADRILERMLSLPDIVQRLGRELNIRLEDILKNWKAERRQKVVDIGAAQRPAFRSYLSLMIQREEKRADGRWGMYLGESDRLLVLLIPESADNWASYGSRLLAENKPGRAIRPLKAALMMAPNDREISFLLAEAREAVGREGLQN